MYKTSSIPHWVLSVQAMELPRTHNIFWLLRFSLVSFSFSLLFVALGSGDEIAFLRTLLLSSSSAVPWHYPESWNTHERLISSVNTEQELNIYLSVIQQKNKMSTVMYYILSSDLFPSVKSVCVSKALLLQWISKYEFPRFTVVTYVGI